MWDHSDEITILFCEGKESGQIHTLNSIELKWDEEPPSFVS